MGYKRSKSRPKSRRKSRKKFSKKGFSATSIPKGNTSILRGGTKLS